MAGRWQELLSEQVVEASVAVPSKAPPITVGIAPGPYTQPGLWKQLFEAWFLVIACLDVLPSALVGAVCTRSRLPGNASVLVACLWFLRMKAAETGAVPGIFKAHQLCFVSS